MSNRYVWQRNSINEIVTVTNSSMQWGYTSDSRTPAWTCHLPEGIGSRHYVVGSSYQQVEGGIVITGDAYASNADDYNRELNPEHEYSVQSYSRAFYIGFSSETVSVNTVFDKVFYIQLVLEDTSIPINNTSIWWEDVGSYPSIYIGLNIGYYRSSLNGDYQYRPKDVVLQQTKGSLIGTVSNSGASTYPPRGLRYRHMATYSCAHFMLTLGA